MTLAYPEARIEDATDTLAGVSFPDPYRWLEQENDEVRQWQRAQARLAAAHVREWPHFERLRQLVARFGKERRPVLPRYAAGKWFRMHIPDGASQSQAIVSDTPMGDGRVLFDPVRESPERPPFLSWISPSRDGCMLALGVCADGSESNTIRLIDVASGQMLPQPPAQTLMDNWSGGAQWLPDSSGFFFTGIGGTAVDFEQRVYLHRRVPRLTTQPVDIPWTGTKEYRMVIVSSDGRHAVALERLNETTPVAVAALGRETLHWRPFVTAAAGTLAGHVVGDRYIAVTYLHAPRGRLVAIPLDASHPGDPESWQELVAESDAVLRTVTPVGEVLYLTEFLDTYARVRIVDRGGRMLGEVPLPGRGAIGEMPFPFQNVAPKGHPDRFIFSYSSLTTSWSVHSHTPGEAAVDTLQAATVRLENAIAEDRRAVSRDGTRIPYHVVSCADAEVGRPRPTLIYVYGGFNAPLLPQFPGAMAAFVAAGGVLVHAHLRGGGEFGLDWWEGGRFANKQNTYDDLYAVAEELIADKRCTPQTLAVTGASNGGLTSAVALTQRPDLWAVVVPRVPRLDLIGACRSSYGWRSTLEDRTTRLEDPAEVRRLAAFSPYHLARDGIRYPAVFIDAGDTDPRCPPQDARKFAARLQRAQAGSAPILVHIWENVGHGPATDRNTAEVEHTEWLAFTLRHLGVREW